MQRNKVRPLLHTTMSSQGNIDLNVKAKTIKLGRKESSSKHTKPLFLRNDTKAPGKKEKNIYELDFTKSKIFAASKDSVKNFQSQAPG